MAELSAVLRLCRDFILAGPWWQQSHARGNKRFFHLMKKWYAGEQAIEQNSESTESASSEKVLAGFVDLDEYSMVE